MAKEGQAYKPPKFGKKIPKPKATAMKKTMNSMKKRLGVPPFPKAK